MSLTDDDPIKKDQKKSRQKSSGKESQEIGSKEGG